VKTRRIYSMERLHRDAWRMVILDTHAQSGSESHNYDARVALHKAVNRLIRTAIHLGQPKGYEPHRKLTRQELARCKRSRRINSKRVKQQEPTTPW
jgi:hypothetical protein